MQLVGNDFIRFSVDLAWARRELACTEADLLASQVRAAALKARVKALEMSHLFVPYQVSPLGYDMSYGYAAMHSASRYRLRKRSREAAFEKLR